MTVHLVKLCVGIETVDELEDWVERRSAENEKAGKGRLHSHITRMRPRRRDELLKGGSIYWVIKGVILIRQKIVGFEERTGSDEIERIAIMLDPRLVKVEPQPRRAFQGWRYLSVVDAPKDLRARKGRQPPPELSIELAELGLL